MSGRAVAKRQLHAVQPGWAVSHARGAFCHAYLKPDRFVEALHDKSVLLVESEEMPASFPLKIQKLVDD